VAVQPSEADPAVDDSADGEDTSPPVASTRAVEIALYLLLIALALVLGYDNWRSGAGWERDGPQSGYLPFYLCVILAGASLWGLGTTFRRTFPRQIFVTRGRLGRVLQVFMPTLLFCIAMQWLGLYVASFLLIAGFMRFAGRIAWWKCILASVVFAAAMFATFEIAFDVLMPKGPLEALFGR
jgi:putative tricarboxylic transport membrane protein